MMRGGWRPPMRPPGRSIRSTYIPKRGPVVPYKDSRANTGSFIGRLARAAWRVARDNPKMVEKTVGVLAPVVYNRVNKFIEGMSGLGNSVKTPNTNPQTRVPNYKAPIVVTPIGAFSRSYFTEGEYSKQKAKEYDLFQTYNKIFYRTSPVNIPLFGQQNAWDITMGDIYDYYIITKEMMSQYPATIINEQSLRYYVNSVSVEMRIANDSSGPMFVDIYDICPRKDYYFQETTGPYTEVTSLWAKGLAQSQPTTNSTGLPEEVVSLGAVPTTCSLFTTMYNIKNKQRIELNAGSTHLHKYTYHVNAHIQQEYINFLSGSFGSVSPIYTRSVMLVFSGGVVHDHTTGNNDIISTNKGRLDVVTTTKYSITAVYGGNTITSRGSYLPINITNPYSWQTNTVSDNSVTTE